MSRSNCSRNLDNATFDKTTLRQPIQGSMNSPPQQLEGYADVIKLMKFPNFDVTGAAFSQCASFSSYVFISCEEGKESLEKETDDTANNFDFFGFSLPQNCTPPFGSTTGPDTSICKECKEESPPKTEDTVNISCTGSTQTISQASELEARNWRLGIGGSELQASEFKRSEEEHNLVEFNTTEFIGMGRSSSSGGGGLRFVQWNESSPEDGLNAGVQRSKSTPTKTMSKNRKKSVDLSAVAPEGVEIGARRTSSNIVARDSRIVMSCLSPDGTFRTPPPPSLKPPRWTPNRRSSSESPRGTSSDGAARAPAHTGSVHRVRNVGHTDTHCEKTDSDTSTPLTQGDHQGRARTGTPRRLSLSPSSPIAGQVRQRNVHGRPSTETGVHRERRPRAVITKVRARDREVSTHNAGRQSLTYTFYNSEQEETGSSNDSSENYDTAIEDIADEGDADATDLVPEYGPGETDAERRRARRYEKKARDREGDRRRAEDKRRNYLLVDQFTGRPYGPGVNDWRKEVILMLKKLDPAIGQINKQPMDAVKEIDEWIQQSWEYSFPMRFEVVKEVVARGVTFRRAELWKKIRQHEPKPEDVTDRAWRSLKKELDNPASIQKSMFCRKANACRVNFGRTGPSGEVGVRERLRRQLRRSRDPHEIQTEMSRDKGYGRHSKRMHMEYSIMHDRDHSEAVALEVAVEGDGIHSDQLDNNDNGTADSPTSTATLTPQQESGHGEPAAAVQVTASQHQIFVDDHIASNPFVVNLMDRLAALENSLSRKSAEVVALKSNKAGRGSDSEPDQTTTEVHATQPTEAADVLHGGIEMKLRVKVPRTLNRLSFEVLEERGAQHSRHLVYYGRELSGSEVVYF